MNNLRLRLYGRSAAWAPQAGVPLEISWETPSITGAAATHVCGTRWFISLDRSDAPFGNWQLEGTLFDDGQVVRRIELIGKCDRARWNSFSAL